MDRAYLVKMANEIAAFYETTESDPGAAVADHIRRFWEPRMILTLVRLVEAGCESLTPIVRAAGARLASAQP